MAVRVAEYLGQRTDVDEPRIEPVPLRTRCACPFMEGSCSKLKKGLQPICSVRKSDQTLWIVCEHRLCATPKTTKDTNGKKIPSSLTEHQRYILWEIASHIYRPPFTPSDILVNREVPIPITGTSSTYKADYIMRNQNPSAKIDEVLLEMQGGGETSQTKDISNHALEWSTNAHRSNDELARELSRPNSIETNAWRRQQEQFLVKGNIVNQTGGKIVFAIGTLIYDYLIPRIQHANLRDLKNHNWTLCIVGMKEKNLTPKEPGPIPIEVDTSRILYTNYSTFVRTLTDQGGPEPSIFEGKFTSLTGEEININHED